MTDIQYIDSVKHSNKKVFESELRKYANMLGIDPNWLQAVMFLESSLNPRAVNSVTGATGLIQFMPATARALGTTTAALKALTGEQQLYYVYKYLQPYAGKLQNFPDVYFAVFFPAAIGQSDDYVLQTSKLSARTIANANQGYDLDKSGSITRGEVVLAITERLKKKAFCLK